MDKIRVGFALTGSFCTFSEVVPIVRVLVEEGYDVTPIFSEFCYNTDTRFGRAADFVRELELITDHEAIHTIVGAEPIGPRKLFDIVVVAPCTGNTLGKLNYGITDTYVTLIIHYIIHDPTPYWQSECYALCILYDLSNNEILR